MQIKEIIIVGLIGIAIGIFSMMVLVSIQDKQSICAYTTESKCRDSINGYLRTYDWMDGWAKNCEKEGKIFTIDKRESGIFLDPRCATEEKTNLQQDVCDYGCNLMFDQINFEYIRGKNPLNRTRTEELLSQCSFDCRGKFR